MSWGTLPLSSRFQHTPPFGVGLPAPSGRPVDILRPDAKDGGQRAPGLAQDLDPTIGDPLPRACEAGDSAAPGEGRGGHAHAPADPSDEHLKRKVSRGRGRHRFEGALDPRDELAPPEDSFIPEVGLA